MIEQYLLHIRSLSKTYRAGVSGCMSTSRALEDVQLDVSRGEIVAIVGAPGAGKTTLLLCAGGLVTPDKGSIERRCSTAYFRDVVPANACADGAAWELALIDNVDRVYGDVAGAFALLSAARRARDCGAALVLAAREARSVERIADRVLLLDRGRLPYPVATRPTVSTRVAEERIR